MQLKFDTRLGRTLACPLEHRGGGVDSDHLSAANIEVSYLL